jgi:hypothetical protein
MPLSSPETKFATVRAELENGRCLDVVELRLSVRILRAGTTLRM